MSNFLMHPATPLKVWNIIKMKKLFRQVANTISVSRILLLLEIRKTFFSETSLDLIISFPVLNWHELDFYYPIWLFQAIMIHLNILFSGLHIWIFNFFFVLCKGFFFPHPRLITRVKSFNKEQLDLSNFLMHPATSWRCEI